MFYFVDGAVNHAGLIYVDGYFYYIDSTYRAVINESRYVSEEWANGLLPPGTYEFGADGKMSEASLPSLTLKEDSELTISNGVLYGLPAEVSASDVAALFEDSDNVVVSKSLVGTGTTITLTTNGITLDTITVMVIGDVNGDGRVRSNDYLLIKKHIESPTFTGVKLEAANVNGDASVNTTDYLRVKRHIAGSFNLFG